MLSLLLNNTYFKNNFLNIYIGYFIGLSEPTTSIKLLLNKIINIFNIYNLEYMLVQLNQQKQQNYY